MLLPVLWPTLVDRACSSEELALPPLPATRACPTTSSEERLYHSCLWSPTAPRIMGAAGLLRNTPFVLESFLTLLKSQLPQAVLGKTGSIQSWCKIVSPQNKTKGFCAVVIGSHLQSFILRQIGSDEWDSNSFWYAPPAWILLRPETRIRNAVAMPAASFPPSRFDWFP